MKLEVWPSGNLVDEQAGWTVNSFLPEGWEKCRRFLKRRMDAKKNGILVPSMSAGNYYYFFFKSVAVVMFLSGFWTGLCDSLILSHCQVNVNPTEQKAVQRSPICNRCSVWVMMIIKFSAGAVYLQNEPWGFLAVYIQKEDCSALKSNLVETVKNGSYSS